MAHNVNALFASHQSVGCVFVAVDVHGVTVLLMYVISANVTDWKTFSSLRSMLCDTSIKSSHSRAFLCGGLYLVFDTD